MNSRQKGNTTQRRAIKYLEELGYLVGKVEQGGRFTKVKDLFGLFDLCCVHESVGVLFVQVKTNQPASQKPLQDFSITYSQRSSCMTWYDRVGWVFHHYEPDGTITRIDKRKRSLKKGVS